MKTLRALGALAVGLTVFYALLFAVEPDVSVSELPGFATAQEATETARATLGESMLPGTEEVVRHISETSIVVSREWFGIEEERVLVRFMPSIGLEAEWLVGPAFSGPASTLETILQTAIGTIAGLGFYRAFGRLDRWRHRRSPPLDAP